MGLCQSKVDVKPDQAALPKLELSQFRLIYQIGKGAFCKVLAVEHTQTNEILAMKFCLKERLLAKKAMNHIIQERHLLEDISSPFICNIKYSFQDAYHVYMVLDLMTGGDLRVHLGSPIPEEGTRIIIAEIALALEYLHLKNIVHRDIKPDNILLDEKGHAYLTDFNVAVRFKPNHPLRSVAGTEPYMAPELFATDEIGYFSSVDWWSLGVLMFEMVYADRPFRGKNKRENIMKGEYRFPSSRSVPISSSCKTCISDFLQLKVESRLGCGLENMKKFREHPFFVSNRIRKRRKKEGVSGSGSASANMVEYTEKITPIKWNKLQQKKIDPVFLPLMPRVVPESRKAKKTEKDVEGDLIKEKEKYEDYEKLYDLQHGKVDPSFQLPIGNEYAILEEQFLYFDHRFNKEKNAKIKGKQNATPSIGKVKGKDSSYVDVSKISYNSLLSNDASSSMYGRRHGPVGLSSVDRDRNLQQPLVPISQLAPQTSSTSHSAGNIAAEPENNRNNSELKGNNAVVRDLRKAGSPDTRSTGKLQAIPNIKSPATPKSVHKQHQHHHSSG